MNAPAITPMRGWKSRRDAAAKTAKREVERAEIRRLRAGLVDGILGPVPASAVEPEAPVVLSAPEPEPAPAPVKAKGKKEKAPIILDGEYLVEED